MTYTGRPPSCRSLPSGGGVPIDGGPPPGQPDDAHGAGLQPRAQPVEALRRRSRYSSRVRASARGVARFTRSVMPTPWWTSAWRGSRSRDTSPAASAAGQNRLPGGDVADPGVRRVEAGVQAAHEQPHPGADRVGERAAARHADAEALLVRVRVPHLEVVEREPGPVDDVVQPLVRSTSRTSDRGSRRRGRSPGPRRSPRNRVSSTGAPGERSMQVAERERARPRRAGGRRCCGPTPAASAPRRNGRASRSAWTPRASGCHLAGASHHGQGTVEGDDRTPEGGRCTSRVPSRGRWRCPAGRRCAEGLGTSLVPRLAAALVVRAPGLVELDGASVHGTPAAMVRRRATGARRRRAAGATGARRRGMGDGVADAPRRPPRPNGPRPWRSGP